MNVRCAIATMLSLALGSLGAPPAAGAADPATEVTIALLPRGTSVVAIAEASEEIAVGVLSAGLGVVPSDQTYLDISQGNRLNDSLYPYELPFLEVGPKGVAPGEWRRVVERAEEAPAQIVPGLLGTELEAAGIEVRALPGARDAALITVVADGSVQRRRDCGAEGCPGVTVLDADSDDLGRLVRSLQGEDLLIALERPPPLRRLLAVGIAGAGFAGRISSETTRTDGYGLATDLAPTILDRYGIPLPAEMAGRPLGSTGGEPGAGEVLALVSRLDVISPRRSPVLGINLVAWIGLALLAVIARGTAGARVALPLLAVTIAWVPALLLLTAALEPTLLAERLIVGLGAPLLSAFATFALASRFGDRASFAAFAIAATVSIGVVAVDVVAGSALTRLSLIGPNPAFGVRFFGIGNELEAVIGVLLALGAGAAVAAARPPDPSRAVAVVAVAAAAVAVAVFAPGSWGADVGAAVTFPAAAAGVVVAALGLNRSRLALIVATPLIALAALIAVDLLIGGDAHLSRSVLEAGGLEELGQVVERRTRLGAASFDRFFESPYFASALVLIVAGIIARERIAEWFAPLPAARAGFIGGIAAGVIGALANDSGSLLLIVGSAYLAAFVGLAWACRPLPAAAPGPSSADRDV